ncbi:MAG: dihydroorotase, partial [Bacteroidota bacterium]
KMCHAPAICFEMNDRGYLDEGMWGDVVIVDPDAEWMVNKQNIHFKCGWSPFEGHMFRGKVLSTIVSGHLAYHEGQFDESVYGRRLTFARS